ncbi:MAG: MmgE/PrpD family protein [Chloroflexi bacterium]|nr:MmgE/PrpD family protein [Chloroflexota bacterium]
MFARDFAWQTLEHVYGNSISHHFARYALQVSYERLPAAVAHQAKRCLLDALGCCIGAFDAPGRPICEAAVKELGGVGEATVFGSGFRTNAVNAALVNSFLVRFLDYNDVGGGGHNSDSIPAILAVAEREGASGKDCLTSIVVSYELGERVTESVIGPSFGERGWTFDVRGGLNMPPALGRLMGLNEDQIASAMGITASHSFPMGIVDAHREENTMAKNLRFGFVACDAILACIMAKKGFTGPARVIEGDSGIRQVLLKGEMDVEHLLELDGWRILDTRHKYLAANANSHGHIYATLAIVKENDLKPEDIAGIHIRAGRREARHTTFLPKKYPRNAENGDHSAYYGNAYAVKYRNFGPDSSRPEHFTDPVILDLISRMTVEADPAMPEQGYAGASEIITKDGRRFQKRVDIPHGFGEDQLTDAELEAKFREMADRHMSQEQVKQIFDAVWGLEGAGDIRKLTGLMTVK